MIGIVHDGADWQGNLCVGWRDQEIPTLGPPSLHSAPELGHCSQCARIVDGAKEFGEIGLRTVHQFEFVGSERMANCFFKAAERHAHVGTPQRAKLGRKRRIFERCGPCGRVASGVDTVLIDSATLGMVIE